MKALTICQPYASLIMGWKGMLEEIRKRVENRVWRCHHSGPLLIHAGKSRKFLSSWAGPVPAEMPFGAILGIADVVDCIPYTPESRMPHHGRRFSESSRQKYPWLFNHMHLSGPYCIILENPVRYATPIPYTGRQGLFNVPAHLLPTAGK